MRCHLLLCHRDCPASRWVLFDSNIMGRYSLDVWLCSLKHFKQCVVIFSVYWLCLHMLDHRLLVFKCIYEIVVEKRKVCLVIALIIRFFRLGHLIQELSFVWRRIGLWLLLNLRLVLLGSLKLIACYELCDYLGCRWDLNWCCRLKRLILCLGISGNVNSHSCVWQWEVSLWYFVHLLI